MPDDQSATIQQANVFPAGQPSWSERSLHSGDKHPHRSHNSIPLRLPDLPDPLSTEPIANRSLTVILPVNSGSLSKLENMISSLLGSQKIIYEIIISCPEAVLADARRVVRKMISTDATRHHMEISLHPFAHGADITRAMIDLASEVATDWILLLDEGGLEGYNNRTQQILTNPRSYPLPIGPRGLLTHHSTKSCVKTFMNYQPASFLVPPFVTPSVLARGHVIASTTLSSWAQFGARISRERLDGIGGIVIGAVTSSSDWCPVEHSKVHREPHVPGDRFSLDTVVDENSWANDSSTGTFAIIFPSLQDMRLFSSVACRLQSNGHEIHVLIYGDSRNESAGSAISHGGCRLNYDTLSSDKPLSSHVDELVVFDWLNTLDTWPNVVVAWKESYLSDLAVASDEGQISKPTLILIPRADLPYCEWMGSLSVEEWTSECLLCPLCELVPTDICRLEHSKC